jgi:DNA (cytosine-5)-methyltransferase 1
MDAMIRLRPSALMVRRVSDLPAISLFSGSGGLDLGVERAGYDVRASVEYDRDACASLRASFPHTRVLEGDIREVPTEAILGAAGLRPGEAELLVGGPPCTPFSKSGYWLEYKRKGLDPNAGLLDHYLRVLAEARPRTFMLENVFALAYNNQNRPWLNRLLEVFAELGYEVECRPLLAADFAFRRSANAFSLSARLIVLRCCPSRRMAVRTRRGDGGTRLSHLT